MDNQMAGGVLAFSLFEDGGTVYQLDGSKISPQSTLDLPRLLRKNAKGGQAEFGKQVQLEIRHSDASLHSTMEAGAHDTLQWKFVMAGFNWSCLCYEANTFTVEEAPQIDPESEDYPFKIIYELQAGSQIARGINVVAAYLRTQGHKIWADEDSNGLADGFTNTGVETVSFAAGVQTITDTAGGGEITLDIPYPIADLAWTFAETVDALRTATPDFSVEFLDQAGAVLSTASVSITAAGEVTVSGTAPAGTFTLRLHLAQDTVAFDVDVSDPVGRVDGKTTYVKG